MHIVRYYPRAVTGDGGMSGAIRRWSESVAALGADVTIAYDAGHAPPSDPKNGVRWAPVKYFGRHRTRYPRDLDRVLEDADLLVLHSAWTVPNVRAAGVARAKKVPYLLEPRGAYDPNILGRHALAKKVWWRAFERELVHGARAIHIFFPEQRAHLEALGYHGDNVIASNGIDSPPQATWDGGSGGYILWLGRFDPEHKGLDLVVDAVASLPRSERPRIVLQGPDWNGKRTKVEGLIKDAGVEDSVSVREAVYGEEKMDVLSKAKGFVYPSRWEGCGNSVLESASRGVPTLTTTYPLGRWLESRGGAFVSQPNASSLAEGLVRLATDPAAAEVADKGARAVRDEMSWDAVARSWLKQVEELV
jgi:glycosyltransferase involved in cell wall biosynthesis